jgi:glucan 1,3-beta-glucosidase
VQKVRILTSSRVSQLTCVGDGFTDDTTAINNAVAFPGTLGKQTHGNSTRCGGGSYPAGQDCGSSTLQPALVYFPEGTYRISNPIVFFYMTQVVGQLYFRDAGLC